MPNQPRSRSQLAKETKAQPKKRKPAAERWKLYRTIEERTLINYAASQTPYADTYRKALARLTDELLCMTTDLTKSIKIRTQEATDRAKAPATTQYAVIKLYIYIRA